MNKEEKESTKLETLIELLYTDRLSQYGKRKLVKYIEKQQKEIEALEIIHNTYKEMIEENNYISKDKIRKYLNSLKYWEDNNTCYLECEGEIFLNKALIVNIFEDLLKEN